MQSASVPCTANAAQQSSMLSCFLETFVFMKHPSLYKHAPEIVDEGLLRFVEGRFDSIIKVSIDSECKLSLIYRVGLQQKTLSFSFRMEKDNCFYKEEKAIENADDILSVFDRFVQVAAYVDFMADNDDEITFEEVYSMFNK